MMKTSRHVALFSHSDILFLEMEVNDWTSCNDDSFQVLHYDLTTCCVDNKIVYSVMVTYDEQQDLL